MPERDSRFYRAAKSSRVVRRGKRNREPRICGRGDRREKSTNLPDRMERRTGLPEEIVLRRRSAAKRLNICCRLPYAAAQSLGSYCESPKEDSAEKSGTQ